MRSLSAFVSHGEEAACRPSGVPSGLLESGRRSAGGCTPTGGTRAGRLAIQVAAPGGGGLTPRRACQRRAPWKSGYLLNRSVPLSRRLEVERCSAERMLEILPLWRRWCSLPSAASDAWTSSCATPALRIGLHSFMNGAVIHVNGGKLAILNPATPWKDAGLID